MKLPHTSIFALFLALSNSGTSLALAAEEVPHPGPRTAAEPAILWEDAQKDIGRGQSHHAIAKLDRLIGRYPRDSRVREATELLIQLRLEHGYVDAAIADAKKYLLGDSKSERAQAVRAHLAEAYLRKKQWTKARATAKELLAKSKDPATQGRALLHLARIDLELGQFSAARARLDALPSEVATPDKQSLFLEIGVRDCDATIKRPGDRVRKEDPWIEYFERKNTCLKALAVGPHVAAAGAAYAHWCKSFDQLSLTLEARPINDYQKDRLRKEFQQTSKLAKPMKCEP